MNVSFTSNNDQTDNIRDEIDSDVETAVEATEFEITNPLDYNLDPQIEAEVIEKEPDKPQSVIAWIQNYWWSIGLPLCFILFLQLIPLPSWIVGFITSFLICVPTTAYITYIMVDENTPRTPFIENVQRKEASRPAIIVQEELKRIYVRIPNYLVSIENVLKSIHDKFRREKLYHRILHCRKTRNSLTLFCKNLVKATFLIKKSYTDT